MLTTKPESVPAPSDWKFKRVIGPGDSASVPAQENIPTSHPCKVQALSGIFFAAKGRQAQQSSHDNRAPTIHPPRLTMHQNCMPHMQGCVNQHAPKVVTAGAPSVGTTKEDSAASTDALVDVPSNTVTLSPAPKLKAANVSCIDVASLFTMTTLQFMPLV